ncbi:MAG: NADH-quinone oxidoreductase subunit N [Candidatus Limnocylindria bacterium]
MEDIVGIAPELWLLCVVVALLAMAPFTRERAPSLTTWLGIAGLLVAGAITVPKLGLSAQRIFGGTYAVDPFALFAKLFVIVAAVAVLLAARDRLAGSTHAVTVPALVVLTSLGAIGLAASVDLVLIALALQITAVASYGLVGALKDDPRANEATLKFFLFAAASGAVMLYGMSLLYALTGTLDTLAMASRVRSVDGAALLLAGALFFTGYAFKITAVPLHWWVPDTYEGTTAPIAGFLSVVPKAAGLAVLLRTLIAAFPENPGWPLGIAVVAALTMSLGNLFALRQESAKRLLAYSSIAQVGYLLMPVAVVRTEALAVTAFLVYLIAYLAMNLAAFLVVGIVERAARSDRIAAFEGLGRSAPWLAASMALLLLSLAGMPPLVGFVGKVALFVVTMAGGYTWLVVIAAANTALSIYYYLRIIAAMYFAEGTAPAPGRARASGAAVLAGAIATLVLGLLPLPLFAFAAQSAGLVGQ